MMTGYATLIKRPKSKLQDINDSDNNTVAKLTFPKNIKYIR